MSTLDKLAKLHGTDKSSDIHNYCVKYEKYLPFNRYDKLTMMEIGVLDGKSLLTWKDYFYRSHILGIDINPECKQYESDGIEIFIGSQDDSTLIDKILKKYPNISIVLDDGSHVMQHMSASFELLYDHLDPNGVYIVEDTHTCYWPEYQGGLRQENSFIENVKNKIDELNAVHTRSAVAVSKFTKSTDSICIYDSIVVFEKRPQGIRQAPITGPM